jgi:hypothetical protein
MENHQEVCVKTLLRQGAKLKVHERGFEWATDSLTDHRQSRQSYNHGCQKRPAKT